MATPPLENTSSVVVHLYQEAVWFIYQLQHLNQNTVFWIFFSFFFLNQMKSAWINPLVKCTWDSDESSGTERRHRFWWAFEFLRTRKTRKNTGGLSSWLFLYSGYATAIIRVDPWLCRRAVSPSTRPTIFSSCVFFRHVAERRMRGSMREASHFNLLSPREAEAGSCSWLNANARLTLHGACWALNWKWEEGGENHCFALWFFFFSHGMKRWVMSWGFETAAAVAPVRPTRWDESENLKRKKPN